MQKQHTLLYSAACRLLVAFLVCLDSLRCVFLRKVDVAHSVVHLIEVFLVVVRRRHSFQTADHLLRPSRCHHLCHRDSCVELQFVRRILPDYVLESLVSLGFIAHSGL